jgi:hypothetical protein
MRYEELQTGDLISIPRSLTIRPSGHLYTLAGPGESVLFFMGVWENEHEHELKQYYFISEHGLGWRYGDQKNDLRLLRRCHSGLP